jgi:S-DNA-T family DNA segregation ATPase FtsK/SpoIIIE
LSAKKSGQSGKANNSKGKSKKGSSAAQAKSAKSGSAERQPILSPEVRLEVLGIVLVVLAIALFIAVVAPGDALVTMAVSVFCRLLFGVGALGLPFLLAAWGASMFMRREASSSRLRLSIGLVTIFVSTLALIAINTSGAAEDPSRVFIAAALVSHGGYLGAVVAYVLLSLVGYAIAMVIGIGAVVVGAVLIGFSLASLAERLNSLFRRDEDDGQPSRGPYDLGDEPSQHKPARRLFAKRRAQEGGGMLTPTARLAERQALSEADQRLDFVDVGFDGEPDDSDAMAEEPDGDSTLGATRRIKGRERLKGGVDSSEAATAKGAAATTGSGTAAAQAASTAAGGQGQSAKAMYELPDMALLNVSRTRATSRTADAELRAVAAELQETLHQFQVDAQVVGWTAGPTVTLYKLALGEGVRVARITSLSDDIALALAASSVRIFSPIPGTSLVGVEVPNAERSIVLLGDVLPAAPSGALQLPIGKDVEGSSIVSNLAGMPHLLIGGTTGSGKSVAINSMIMGILMRATPAEVRMILIDPKMVELTRYNDIPHLYVPVVTDAAKAAAALAWGVIEMERRLKIFMDAGVKNIAAYNEQVRAERQEAIQKAEKAAAKQAEKDRRRAVERAAEARDLADSPAAAAMPAPLQAGAPAAMATPAQPDGWDELYGNLDDEPDWRDDDTGLIGDAVSEEQGSQASEAALGLTAEPAAGATDGVGPSSDLLEGLPEEMPLIVIVIDELADLMIVAGKDVEASVTRLSQLARAAGLHLIIATQRPSTNVITGVIKANIVNRIAFNVGSGIDSRVILDSTGAEALLGNGDLLYSKPEYGKPARIQGCFVSEAEINAVTDFWKQQGRPDYHEDILATAVGGISTYQAGGLYDGADSDDPLVWEAADIVVTTQMGSTSTLQRRLKVGYARAGRIMDNLEQKGIVGPANGSKPREVMLDDVLELESLRAIEAADR